METLVYASSAAEARNRAQVEGPAAADADDEARHRRAPAAARPLRGRVQGGHGRCRIVLIILTILIHPPSPPHLYFIGDSQYKTNPEGGRERDGTARGRAKGLYEGCGWTGDQKSSSGGCHGPGFAW
jgi:hypothetical protein